MATIAFRHDGSRALYLARDGSSNLSPISGIDNNNNGNGNDNDKYSNGFKDGIYIPLFATMGHNSFRTMTTFSV